MTTMTITIDKSTFYKALEDALNNMWWWGLIDAEPKEAVDLIQNGETFEVFHGKDHPSRSNIATVTAESVRRGAELLANDFTYMFANIMAGNADSADLNYFLQLVCFGDIIY